MSGGGDNTSKPHIAVDPYPEPLAAGTLYTAPSMNQGDIATAQDAADCPHLQPGVAAWENPAMWGGIVPSTGTVTLPTNQRVLLTAGSLPPGAVLKQIIVPYGSELIFDDTDMTITTGSILVRGALRAGSPTCRLQARIVLDFVANSDIESVYMVGIFFLPGQVTRSYFLLLVHS